MPLYSLTTCDWSNRRRKDTVIKDPAWEDIEAAIRKLDNENFNDIHLHRDEDSEDFWLSVGGGAGRYFVTRASADEFPNVVDLTRANLPDELLCVGGQNCYLPARWILP